LAREAFKVPNPNSTTGNVGIGLLTDASISNAEQQGMSDLFAGAMASFRNPPGHKNLDVHPREAPNY
jgi:hypothetical protein